MNKSILCSSLKYVQKNYETHVSLSKEIYQEYLFVNKEQLWDKILAIIDKYQKATEDSSRNELLEILVSLWKYLIIVDSEGADELLCCLIDSSYPFEIIKIFASHMDSPTGLWIAAYHGNIEVMRLLLEYGDKISDQYDKAMRQACYENHTDAAKLLLEYGANPNPLQRYEGDMIPLMDAIYHKNHELAEILLICGASPNPIEKRFFSQDHLEVPLVSAIDSEDYKMVYLLLRYGADPNIDNGNPLKFAIFYKQKDIFDLLLIYGAKMLPSIDNELILKATESKDYGLFKKLIDVGPKKLN